MDIQNLIRWSGLILLIAGFLYMPGVFHPPDTPEGLLSPAWAPVHYIFFIHHMLLMFGLIGLYLYLADKAGWLGLIAFIMTSAANAIFPTLDLVQVTLLPTLSKYPATQSLASPRQAGAFGLIILVSVVVALVGNILLGISIMRAGVFSRWAGLLIMLGWVLFFFGSGSSTLSIMKPFGIVLTGIGYIWSGYAIWKARDGVPHTAQASAVR